MTNILGIVGSPRRNGNTHLLVSHVLKGAREAGAATAIVLLGDLTIAECDGCHACWRGKLCPKGDDMNALYPRIIESDVLVLGTPVYWYGPTALIKAFIDRLVYFNCAANRPGIRGKSAAVAIPLEEESAEAARLLVAFFEKCFAYLELRFAGRIIVPGVTRRGAVRKSKERLEEARELGRTLGRAGP